MTGLKLASRLACFSSNMNSTGCAATTAAFCGSRSYAHTSTE
jgi:hypothetical protein